MRSSLISGIVAVLPVTLLVPFMYILGGFYCGALGGMFLLIGLGLSGITHAYRPTASQNHFCRILQSASREEEYTGAMPPKSGSSDDDITTSTSGDVTSSPTTASTPFMMNIPDSDEISSEEESDSDDPFSRSGRPRMFSRDAMVVPCRNCSHSRCLCPENADKLNMASISINPSSGDNSE